ncbi:MAG: acyl-CoA thioesterase [Pseudomonadota bacterium]|nr:acyl-CoA thioesterase [Pseudomonadota bacterium]
MPADTNPYGGVFGGWLMSQMALAAGSLASRHSRGKCVVVAADGLSFTGAPKVGDEISVYADLARQGRSSMTIAVTLEARERDSDTLFEVAKGNFTFVALDDTDRPRPIAAEEHHG